MGSTSFNNPFLQHLGARLVEWSAGHATFHLPLHAALLNRIGQVHGGVICALLDASAGYSGIYSAPGEPARNGVTLSLSTSFLDSGKGGLLVGRGRMQRRGRAVFFAESEVTLDDSLLIAKGIGTFRYIEVKGPNEAAGG